MTYIINYKIFDRDPKREQTMHISKVKAIQVEGVTNAKGVRQEYIRRPVRLQRNE